MATDRPEITPAAIERARQWARFLRSLGYNALPSRMNIKGPMLATYADYWDRPLPDGVYDAWNTSNVQVMTGARWKLAVVDCDGDEAHQVWRRMRNHHGQVGPTPTWVVRTGGGGWHYYFTLPDDLPACPTRRLWGVWDTWAGPKHAGDWLKHREVRLLGDRALAIAPPSTHVETGATYEFLKGRGPDDFPRPAPAPAWLLNMPAIVTPRTVEDVPTPPLELMPLGSPRRPAGAFPGRDDVLAAVADKIALARSWGLRIASRGPNPKGWLKCHAIDRPDAHPSCSIHHESGVYVDLRDSVVLPFFDLAVALGRYPTWLEAKDDLAARFLPARPLAGARLRALA
jgi:hypothetical protein